MAYQGKFSQSRNDEEIIQTTAEVPETEPSAVAEDPRTPVDNGVPVRQDAPPKKPRRKKRRKKKANRNVTIIFYTLYFLMIAAFFAGMFFLNGWLHDRLVDYEAAQPGTKCEQVFQELFAAPDWQAIYTLTGLEDTPYEDADAFAGYMAEKVSGGQLSYAETTSDLSGEHTYLLKLGEETLGHFTLVDQAPQGAELPDWQLGQVSLYAGRSRTVLIQIMKGRSVSVNGVALTREDIIQISSTRTDACLPDGVSAPTTWIYQVEGLMGDPRITVTDGSGRESTVTYDPESGMYIEQAAVHTISEDEKTAALAAAEVFARYMIEAADDAELSGHFDFGSDIYKAITGMTPWMQNHSSYEFSDREVSRYCRYSGELFSARVQLSLNVTRRNGTVKKYSVDNTLFFRWDGNSWLVFDMAGAEVSAPVSEVRLTFRLGDSVIFSNLYNQDVTAITAPVVTLPEGQVFAGWARQDIASDGSLTYTLVFTPSKDGTISLPSGTLLEPMTLYALFEDVEGGNE